MTTYNTGDPLGTVKPENLYDNTENLDYLMMGTEHQYPDRLGVGRKSWAGIEAASANKIAEIDNIITSLDTANFTFASVAAGIAGTTDGQYFRVPQGTNAARSFIYYTNTSDQAVAVAYLIGPGYVDERLVPGSYSSELIPVMHDKNGTVPIWLDKSCLDAAGLGPVLQSIITNLPNVFAQNILRQFGYSPDFMPLWFDVNGNVPAWLDGGRFDAAGLGPVLSGIVSSTASGNSPLYLLGDVYKLMLKQSKIFNGQSASVNVAFTGDSWTEKNTIPQSLINVLGGSYKDPGWISCSTRADAVMSGITLTTSGFTKYDGDQQTNNAPPPYGSGPDGNAYYNNNVVGTLTWSGVTATDLSLFYYDGSGAFTITIDGGEPITITGGNTGTAKKYDLNGLTATSHTVVVRSSGTGVVSILGMYGKNSSIQSGITVSRMGNGAAISKDYLHWENWIEPIVTHLDIDLLFIILGTNDFRLSAGVAEYRQGIEAIITHYKAATPGVCICLVSPPQSNATGSPAIYEYDSEMKSIAIENGVSFISGYKSFPTTYDNSQGTWEDTLHLSKVGAYLLTKQMKSIFFQE